jgi:hypothetical protein
MDPEYHLKKRIEEQRYNKLPVDSILFFYEDDEKEVQVAAKTYDGISWSSSSIIQSKIFKAQQKINGFLNVFDGTYDHTNNNNQMWTYHSYKQKIGMQFLDFIKRIVDQKYGSNIKQIFMVLDKIQYTDQIR